MTDEATTEGGPGGGTTGLASTEACVIRLRPDQAVVPQDCACCGDVASRTTREVRVDGQGILVPYCAECHAHASRGATRVLATSIAALLLVTTLAGGLPLIFQPPSVVVYILIVSFGALAPVLVAHLRSHAPSNGHAADGRAVFFQSGGALVCLRPHFGKRLAQGSGVSVRRIRVREPILSYWAILLSALVIGLCPVAYRFHFPEIRVVNLTEGRLTFLVDGRPRAVVNPTSAESPNAGVVLRLPAGTRTLSATDSQGLVVDTATVVVAGGQPHLYAPASAGTCFWVETTGYGRSRGTSVRSEPLTGDPRFWALPSGIDFWFSPAPSADADGRSTGGLLRALRQAPCSGPGSGGDHRPPP